MEPTRKYWFASQRYGARWGYGQPIAWQGWLVTILYYAFVFAGLYFLTHRGWFICLTIAAACSGLFLLVLKWKGAPRPPSAEIL